MPRPQVRPQATVSRPLQSQAHLLYLGVCLPHALKCLVTGGKFCPVLNEREAARDWKPRGEPRLQLRQLTTDATS